MQQGLWFYPTLMTISAMLLAVGMLSLDQGFLADREIHRWWLFQGGAEGARGVLSTIAGTMMTIATTVFSITIVALQLSSTQLSPRVLRGFTADRGNQVVLGTFVATFAYTLVVLRRVQSESADRQVFVPAASVSLAILLSLAAIASLIYFFHHATRVIQASVIIDRTLQDALDQVDAQLADQESKGDERVMSSAIWGVETEVEAGRSGYVTSVDVDLLLETASTYACLITIRSRVGSPVLSATPVAAYALTDPRRLSDDDRKALEDDIRDSFGIGLERTLEQDVLLGYRQLADIAVKALSPGINDAATALTCVDRLGEGLLRARSLRTELWMRIAEHRTGAVRGTSIGFADVLNECLPQIRHYIAGDVVLVQRLLETLGRVADGAAPAAMAALSAHAQLIAEAALRQATLTADRGTIEAAVHWVVESQARAGSAPNLPHRTDF